MSSYKCSKCDYTSKTKGLVKKHINNVSRCVGASMIEDIVEVECEICNKKFETEKLLQQHKKSCIERRAVVMNTYTDPKEVMENIRLLISTIKKQELIIVDLIGRVEKLEENKKTSVECDSIDANDEIACDKKKVIKFVPINYVQVCNMMKKYNLEDEINVEVTVDGQRSNVLEGNIENEEFIDVEGIKYYYNGTYAKKQKLHHTGDLKIVITHVCEEYALHRTDKGCFCDEHVY